MTSNSECLSRILNGLRSKSEEVQAAAADELRSMVNGFALEGNSEQVAKLMNEVNRKIFELVHSSENNEKIGGILAIERLMDFEGEDNTTTITRFANYLRIVLTVNDAHVALSASRALGRLALVGGTLTAEFVEFEVKRALEWLQSERYEHRRYAAVLVLGEFARNSPTLIYSYVLQYFELAGVALRDGKVWTRESGALTLGAYLALVYSRESSSRNMWYRRLYDDAMRGIKAGSVENVHGSLLMLKELIEHTGSYLEPRYSELAELIFQFRDHKDPLIRKTVIQLQPFLAQFDSKLYAKELLNPIMSFFLMQLKKDKDRALIYDAIGDIVLVVGPAFGPYLEPVIYSIKELLVAKSKIRSASEDSAFRCLSLLARAVGPALTKYIHELLEPMFAGGISKALIESLKQVVDAIPQLLSVIQEHLFVALSDILQPDSTPDAFQESFAVANTLTPTLASMSLGGGSIGAANVNGLLTGGGSSITATGGSLNNPALLILALETLGSFDFTGLSLHELMRRCSSTYLEDDSVEVRRAAAVTTCKLLARDPIVLQTSSHALLAVESVLEQLLVIGITDPDPTIRLTVLLNLDARFDHHLAQAEHVKSLFVALNDETFAVREAAITVIGRLTAYNPAYVLPNLRKTLIQLLTELEYSTVARNKESAARLLSKLVASSRRLVKPYVEPILKVLLPKAKDPSSEVVAQVLAAIGAVAEVGGEAVLPYVDRIFPLAIDTLKDQSNITKREAALSAMGHVSRSTGVVIEPLINYPTLLPTLVKLLKTEQSASVRRECLKLFGILGALDPFRHTVTSLEQQKPADESTQGENSLPMVPLSEDHGPTVAIQALMRILNDQSLSAYHTAVVQAVMYIFKTLGLKCVPYLPRITPALLQMMRHSPQNMLEFHFQQLGALVTIVKQHIRPFLPELFALAQTHWDPNAPSVQITILSLIEAIARALDGEFKIYLSTLLPPVLSVFEQDNTEKRLPTHKALHVLLVFGANLDEYLHILVPCLVRLVERTDVPLQTRKLALQTVAQLTKKVSFSDQISRLLHALVRVLYSSSPELRNAALDTICAVVYHLGLDFAIFIPLVNKTLARLRQSHSKYEMLVNKLLQGAPLPQELGSSTNEDALSGGGDLMLLLGEDTPLADTAQLAKKLPVNQQHLKRAWETSQRSTRDDWYEWIRRFSVELLKESPSQALRACASLAGQYYPLARELFNAAFLSCWTELYDQFQDELIRSLVLALKSPNIPPEVLQLLLNLAEFMEHDDKPLPIDIATLGQYALKCHAYAKALHYKELEFASDPHSNIEALISINDQLQQLDSAVGILTFAQQNHDVELKESWYEKLQRWDDALAAYERKQKDDPDNVEWMVGRMRCLNALGEWENLSELAQKVWPTVVNNSYNSSGKVADLDNTLSIAQLDNNAQLNTALPAPALRKIIPPLAAAAAWALGEWEQMEAYISAMKKDSPDAAFFKSILAFHRKLYPQSLLLANKTRDLLDTELTALLGESYSRAYAIVVRIQMLAEMEEIVTYQQLFDDPERQALMRRTWMKRLNGCQRNVETWQRILKVRSLVVSPKTDMDMWIQYADLCRKSGRLTLAQKNLLLLSNNANQVPDDWTVDPPQLVYAYLKYQWASGQCAEALKRMKELAQHLLQQLGYRSLNELNTVSSLEVPPDKLSTTKLLARCYLKTGEWESLQHGDAFHSLESEQAANGASSGEANSTTENAPSALPSIPSARNNSDVSRTHHSVLVSYSAATWFDRDWYKAWHAWALVNFQVVQLTEQKSASTNTNFGSNAISTPISPLVKHIVPAIHGFSRSIALSDGSSLQDTLRFLTLWFKYGALKEAHDAVALGIKSVSIDTWLQVIPQLIARIHAPAPAVRQLIHQLLISVGKEHPQALVYSLTVASKSQSLPRKAAATSIMDKMRSHSARLVEQALLVSQELIRVAILWHEMWHEGLEEASRLYFGDRNVQGMFATLEPLHKMLERGPETLREISFNQAYGRDLQEALEWCTKYKSTLNVNDLNQAWDLYYHVFRKINKQLPQLTTLELHYVSPKLLGASDLDLAVPGTYTHNAPVITIAQFSPTLSVITSKQRPRKLSIKGSDGREYQYLLKGHEDLRQDERVMQLFDLVNMLLEADAETFKRHLSIQRYPVIPLSPNSGLIGWVPHCDTLHSLIRDYRESRKILLNIEHRLMLQMAPDYDMLKLLEKVEVFEYALQNTTGQDLYKVLWLKSRNSEIWLERRTNYTRSVAVMSIVGYILGLGDRHPSNLMLDRYSGRVLHIDFGDCFEVAMQREKFPERIPFRLTRMLINAMEVSGIEGNFRITCQHTMRVLRDNKDSLMAVLEAFVYDPLINWRLMTTTANTNGANVATTTTTTSSSKSEAIAVPPEDSEQVEDLDGVSTSDKILSAKNVAVSEKTRANRGHMSLMRTENEIIDAEHQYQQDGRKEFSMMNSSHGNSNVSSSIVYKPEALNARAVAVIQRVQNKLTGRDFRPNQVLDVPLQVQRLIVQATSLENLCQCYIGWCAFW